MMFTILMCVLGDTHDAIDATCRVRAGGTGSGVVWQIDDQFVWLLTNAHVVDTSSSAARAGDAVKCDFWHRGHKLDDLDGYIKLRSGEVDVAVIAVPKQQFPVLPPVITFAREDLVLNPGEPVFSVGCANGAHPTAFKGHIIGYSERGVEFYPPPAGGRSGSALFNEGGTQIIGLVHKRAGEPGSNGSTSWTHGLAVPIQSVRYAMYGDSGLNMRYNDASIYPPIKVETLIPLDGRITGDFDVYPKLVRPSEKRLRWGAQYQAYPQRFRCPPGQQCPQPQPQPQPQPRYDAMPPYQAPPSQLPQNSDQLNRIEALCQAIYDQVHSSTGNRSWTYSILIAVGTAFGAILLFVTCFVIFAVIHYIKAFRGVRK